MLFLVPKAQLDVERATHLWSDVLFRPRKTLRLVSFLFPEPKPRRPLRKFGEYGLSRDDALGIVKEQSLRRRLAETRGNRGKRFVLVSSVSGGA